MAFKQFEGTTYEEWLENHYKNNYKEIVFGHIGKFPHITNWGKIGKEKNES